jgi:tetratricopeptide (TPR) repeat protein
MYKIFILLKGKVNKYWLFAGILALVTFVVYFNSLKAPFILDDKGTIVDNPDIKKLSSIGTRLIYPYKEGKTTYRNDPSRPLVYLTYTLNYYLGGLDPAGYRLYNIMLHLFNSLLLFFLSKKILEYPAGEPVPAYLNLVPYFVSLFFCVHPLNIDAVTYVFGRSSLMVTFFYVLSVLLFVRSYEKGKKISAGTICCFILALASKQSAVTLPLVILLFDYIFLCDFRIKKLAAAKYTHILIWVTLAAYLLWRYLYFGGIGDLVAVKAFDRYSYLITQPYIILNYLKLLLIPSGFSIDHSISPSVSLSELRVLLSLAVVSGLFAIIAVLFRKKTVASKVIIFGLLWFFITLSPTSSFFPTTSIMVERRMYLSGFGIYFLVAFLFFSVLKAGVLGRPYSFRELTASGLPLLCLLLLGTVTVKRNKLYRAPELLWREVISMYPQKNFGAYHSLGTMLLEKGDHDGALESFRMSLKIKPDYARGYCGLGNVYYAQKNYNAAAGEYVKALKADRNFSTAYSNLGVIYKEQGDLDGAVRELKNAAAADPGNTSAHYYLAVIYQMKHEYDKARKWYEKTLDLDPGLADARCNYGVLLSWLKEYDKAVKEYQKAIRIKPDYINAYENLGKLFFMMKNYEKSIKVNKKIIKIDINNFEAHKMLGKLFFNTGKYEDSLKEFEVALKLRPEDNSIKSDMETARKVLKDKL